MGITIDLTNLINNSNELISNVNVILYQHKLNEIVNGNNTKQILSQLIFDGNEENNNNYNNEYSFIGPCILWNK